MTLKENYYYKITNNTNNDVFFGLNLGRNSFIYNIFPVNNRIRKASLMPTEEYTISNISHEEWKYIMRTLIANNYYFEQSSGVHPMRTPTTCHITYFNNIETGLSGFGVYFDAPGDNVYMKAYITASSVYFEDLQYNVGKKTDIYFKPVSKAEEKKFNSVLERYGKQYVYAVRKVIPSNEFRAKPGQVYYYINDRFTISSKPDTHKGTDTSRFYAGNYYMTIEEAAHAARQMCDILSRRQVSAISKFDSNNAGNVVSDIYVVDDDIIVRRKKGRPKKS